MLHIKVLENVLNEAWSQRQRLNSGNEIELIDVRRRRMIFVRTGEYTTWEGERNGVRN
jgi:hypothetical protein